MIKLKLVAGVAAVVAVALPAQAKAASFSGTVLAKQSQRGTLLLVGARGIGRTVHVSTSRIRLGDRVAVQGRAVRVLGHTDHAVVRGVVVRQLRSRLLVADGGSMLSIRFAHARGPASAGDHGGLQPGDVMQVGVSIQNDELDEDGAPVQVGQATTAQIEGRIVSLSPLVVSVEGLPITIAVPAGTTLPATLAPGDRIELTVQIGAGNTFTLASIDQAENEDENGNQAENNNEVEVTGTVASSTASQIVVMSGGSTFTFAAPAGVTLPTLPAGTAVEVRGVRINGVLTVQRLKVENQDDGNDSSGSGGQNGSGNGDGGGDGGGGGD
jgi:hypothetical protein